MNWIVLKYGGSSITKKGFKSIDKRINELKDKFKIVIVLSAKKNVTNFFFFQHSLMLNTDTNHKKMEKIMSTVTKKVEHLEIQDDNENGSSPPRKSNKL